MIDIIRREGIYLWYYFSVQFEQIFMYWVLGISVGSVISVFGKAKIHSLLLIINRKNLGLFGLILMSVIGIASPLCMYGTVPIVSSFHEKGVREGWLAAFMMSSVLLNPQLIIYSIALGRTMLIIRIVSSILCGIFAGMLVHYFFKGKSFFNFKAFKEPPNRDTHPNLFIRFAKNVWRNIKATGLYFLAGIALSAIFQRYVQADTFAALFGSGNRGFGLLMAATMGVPLYVCGGGTIPLLMAWLDNGMSMGSATAFMITGPSTKLTNLGAVKMVLGIKHFVIYLVFAILFALLSGFIINSIWN
jgi:uncharacterized membrane protein YraQ (UPF0718 family)